MWVPASVPFLIAIFAAAYRWLDPSGGRRRGAVIRPRPTTEGDLMAVASFLTGSLLTLLIPLGLLILVGIWWALVDSQRRRASRSGVLFPV